MELDELTLPERVVLLGVASLETDDDVPAHGNEITRRCDDLTDHVADVGRLTGAEVGRALNKLEAEGYVTVPSIDDQSPTGKGRPAYTLSADAVSVMESLSADDRLAGAVEA